MASTATALVAAAGAILTTSAAPALPPPEGRFAVGRTRWIVADDSRTDPFDGATRRVEVVAWYPATAARRGAQPAPYLLDGIEEVRGLATVFGNRTLLDDLGAARIHASADAPPRPGRDRFPLLVFSHGYTSIASASTALLEDLASHGFVVLSVVHPYEATAATIADGKTVTTMDGAGKFRQPIQDVFAEWRNEDQVLAEVTGTSDAIDQRRLLRDYNNSLVETRRALQRWVDDVRAVLARAADVPHGTPIARVLARTDLGRFGVFGHSMGGVMAGEFCLAERRCAAVLNLDGSPQSGSMIETKLDRPLLMVYSARPGRIGASDAIYKRAASRYYRVDVADTLHLDFTDMALWPPLRERHIVGVLPGERAVRITRAIVREFFDQELRGRRSRLLAGESHLAGVDVTRP